MANIYNFSNFLWFISCPLRFKSKKYQVCRPKDTRVVFNRSNWRFNTNKYRYPWSQVILLTLEIAPTVLRCVTHSQSHVNGGLKARNCEEEKTNTKTTKLEIQKTENVTSTTTILIAILGYKATTHNNQPKKAHYSPILSQSH